jgi:Flp pilus assembly protein CpaB
MSRISPGTIIVGIFAVLFGLAGAYAVREYLTQKPVAEEAPRPRIVNVPTASIDIEPGRKLTYGDIAILRLTPEQVRERNLPENYMLNTQQITDRMLRNPLKKGDVFLTTDFYPQGMGPSVAERLKPGYRAMTVPIVNYGLASPGAQVDVLFRTVPQSENDLDATTVTLLENVEILALGQTQVPGSATRPGHGNVTLAVLPKQASALDIVKNRGELSLVLRGPSDVAMNAAAPPQTLETLLGLQKPTFSTEVYRGGKLQVNTFRQTETAPFAFTRLPIGSDREQPVSIEPDADATNATSIDVAPNADPTEPLKTTQTAPADEPAGVFTSS